MVKKKFKHVLMKVVCGSFQGLCFIRTSRPESNIIYNCNEEFHVGQAKVSSIIFTTPGPVSALQWLFAVFPPI